MALLAAAGGCAPTQGWQHTDRRACAPQSPPVLCLGRDVDGLHELRVGPRVLLPGECMVGPVDERGGRLRVELVVGGRPRARPAVRVRAGWRTEVAVDGDQVVVVERRRCDRTVDPGT